MTLALTPLLLAGELWKSTQVTHLRHHPLLAVAAVIAALVVTSALAAIVRARPQLLALLAVVALPFRFSVLSGGTGGVLLLLYVVIAAGSLALVVAREDPDARRPVGALERTLAAVVVLYALQALYTPDLGKATQEVGFFLVPFALLYVLLIRVRWDRALLQRCARAVVALALLFVAVAAVEYASRRLVFHASLNVNQRFFRVNSLFYDPNIYGRFVALTIVLVAAAMMWERRTATIARHGALLGVLMLGLVGSVSESSLAALLAGVAVIAATRLPRRTTAVAAAIVVAAIVVVAIGDSGRLHIASTNDATGGRASLITEGITLFGDRPLQGFGSGSFSCEYRRHLRHADPQLPCGTPAQPGVTSDSHTAPVTVAAEQGVLGLLAYVGLLAAALLTLARATSAGGLRASPARVAILAAFVALVTHTWGYADFLEDPISWALLAVGGALARE
jgi:putative inorganic carbon (HCO3(-)) transporter